MFKRTAWLKWRKVLLSDPDAEEWMGMTCSLAHGGLQRGGLTKLTWASAVQTSGVGAWRIPL